MFLEPGCLNFLHCSFAIRHKKVEMVVGFHLHVLLLYIRMSRPTCHVFHLHKLVFMVMVFFPLPSKLRPSHLTLCLATMWLKMHCLLLRIYGRQNVHIRKKKMRIYGSQNVHLQKPKCAYIEKSFRICTFCLSYMRIYGSYNAHIRKLSSVYRASVYAHFGFRKCAF